MLYLQMLLSLNYKYLESIIKQCSFMHTFLSYLKHEFNYCFIHFVLGNKLNCLSLLNLRITVNYL